jgi:uncharacterized protein YecE (DUF72 family)
MDFYIGTSGYNYKHWFNGVFYPPGIKENELLLHYQEYFNSVELNVTFYRLPSEKVFKSWYKKTKEDFGFIVKGSRFITHIKRLKDVEEPINLFSQRCYFLKEKLLCILWQLPPSFRKDVQKLQNFINCIKKNDILKSIDHSIEFRHSSWFEEDVLKILKENNINLCIAHSSRWPMCEAITSNFLYIRFHGGEILYGSEYSINELKEWVKKIKTWRKNYQLNKFYIFFNNDAYGFAVKNALQLRKLLLID